MATTAPGSGPNLVRDAHYHPIKATATWAAFMAQMKAAATNSVAERDEEERDRERQTTYARGILGEH